MELFGHLPTDALVVRLVTQEAVRLPSEQVVVAAAEGVAVERKEMVQRAAMAAMAGDATRGLVAAVLQGEAGKAGPMAAAVGMPPMMERMAMMGRGAMMERQAPKVQQVVFQVPGGSPVGRVVWVEMVREVAAAKGEAVAQGRGGGHSVRMELERAAVAVGVAVAGEQAAQEAGAAAPAMGSSWSAMVAAAMS